MSTWWWRGTPFHVDRTPALARSPAFAGPAQKCIAEHFGFWVSNCARPMLNRCRQWILARASRLVNWIISAILFSVFCSAHNEKVSLEIIKERRRAATGLEPNRLQRDWIKLSLKYSYWARKWKSDMVLFLLIRVQLQIGQFITFVCILKT